ncbi:UNVERIFIED_CONTAM: Thioredoxin H2 [Sesamum angustifolium]|uniref:Thioredoxin H2 n=1 Tax=Sesamum angustifolium TaxID=2727405 RepID=A0AAW2IZA4_9LAMI
MLNGDAAAAESNTDESSEPSRVIAFHSAQRWQLHFNSSKQLNKLMVVDFSATWCGPCKFMEPVFNNLAAKYTDVDFVKIDVDELSDVCVSLSSSCAGYANIPDAKSKGGKWRRGELEQEKMSFEQKNPQAAQGAPKFAA